MMGAMQGLLTNEGELRVMANEIVTAWAKEYERRSGVRAFPMNDTRNRRQDAVRAVLDHLRRGESRADVERAMKGVSTPTYVRIGHQLAGTKPQDEEGSRYHSPEVDAAVDWALLHEAPNKGEELKYHWKGPVFSWHDQMRGALDNGRKEMLDAWLCSKDRVKVLTARDEPVMGKAGSPVERYLRSNPEVAEALKARVVEVESAVSNSGRRDVSARYGSAPVATSHESSGERPRSASQGCPATPIAEKGFNGS